MYYKKELRTQYTQFFSQIYFCDTSDFWYNKYSMTYKCNDNDTVICQFFFVLICIDCREKEIYLLCDV